MTAAPRHHGRIARVRRLQHAARVVSLEGSDARLGALRGLLLDHDGASLGMALAARHELAGRLDAARYGLADAITGARAAALEQDRQRLAARIDREAADRLADRAALAAAAALERRPAAAAARRRYRGETS